MGENCQNRQKGENLGTFPGHWEPNRDSASTAMGASEAKHLRLEPTVIRP